MWRDNHSREQAHPSLASKKRRWSLGIAFMAALLVLGTALLATGSATLTPAATAKSPTAARVLSASGRVTASPKTTAARKAANTYTRTLRAGDSVLAGWEVVTGPGSRAELEVQGPARIVLGPTSAVLVAPGSAYKQRNGTTVQPVVRVNIGTVLVHVLKNVARLMQFYVETPTAVAGVRGTVFDVRVATVATTRVSVFEGQVDVTSLLSSGELASAVVAVVKGEEVAVTLGVTRPTKSVQPKTFQQLWQPRQGWLKEQHSWEQKEHASVQKAAAKPTTQKKDLLSPGQSKESKPGASEAATQGDGKQPHGSALGWWKKEEAPPEPVADSGGVEKKDKAKGPEKSTANPQKGIKRAAEAPGQSN